jgi:2-polyprenyl-3-methyl-5-hydroxy-6-metoxy-1,4-benzoquinol methylase
MISDGQISGKSLNKSMCMTCGLGFHTNPNKNIDIRSIYDVNYSLGSNIDSGSILRNEEYSNQIIRILNEFTFNPKQVLEVGCGNGGLLNRLAIKLPQANLDGIEPSPQPRQVAVNSRVNIFPGFFEDKVSDRSEFYDLIISVNVIEHTANPAKFLANMKKHLSRDGLIVVVCPDGNVPSVDLLFYDHMFHFTTNSLHKLSATCELNVIHSKTLDSPLTEFQMFLLSPSKNFIQQKHQIPAMDFENLSRERNSYLQNWQSLDCRTKQFLSKTIVLFGAGELANLCRCYMPELWQNTSYVCVDHPDFREFHGKPVIDTNELDLMPKRELVLLIAVSGQSSQSVKLRFSQKGYETFSISDWIS